MPLKLSALGRSRAAVNPHSAAQGFTSVADRLQAKEEQGKVRTKPELFAEHYNQAKLFFDSQTDVEQAHIAAAFSFELIKLTVPAIRQRVLSMLRNASETLAAKVAEGLNMALPEAMPLALNVRIKPEVSACPSLSATARAERAGRAGPLLEMGVVARFVAPRIGPVSTEDRTSLEADASLENEPGFPFDALLLPDGAGAVVAPTCRRAHAGMHP
jgi:catalase